MRALGRNLETRQRISLPAAIPPALMIVVDTEEEFDWDAGVDRHSTQVTAMREIGRLQDAFEEFGHKPTYVIDYPVATDEFSVDRLSVYQKQGRAQVGGLIYIRGYAHRMMSRYHSTVLTKAILNLNWNAAS